MRPARSDANYFYLIGRTPPGFDPVPMILWLSSLLYLWSISSSRLFTVMPIAKNSIFSSVNDGVIVLDEFYRLVAFNQGCKNMFPHLNKSMFKLAFARVCLELYGDACPFPLKMAVHTQELQIAAADHLEHAYQVRISSLQHANHGNGLLIFLLILQN